MLYSGISYNTKIFSLSLVQLTFKAPLNNHEQTSNKKKTLLFSLRHTVFHNTSTHSNRYEYKRRDGFCFKGIRPALTAIIVL